MNVNNPGLMPSPSPPCVPSECEMKHTYGLGRYDVMPHWMQVQCIQWMVGKKIPVLCVWKPTNLRPTPIVKCVNFNFLQSYLLSVGSRFLLYYNARHLICCRTVFNDQGKIVCKLMDTCRDEMPFSVEELIKVLGMCKSLPHILRERSFVDPFCKQQMTQSGGCVVISICNLYLRDCESASADEGEDRRTEFSLLNPNILEIFNDREAIESMERKWDAMLVDL